MVFLRNSGEFTPACQNKAEYRLELCPFGLQLLGFSFSREQFLTLVLLFAIINLSFEGGCSLKRYRQQIRRSWVETILLFMTRGHRQRLKRGLILSFVIFPLVVTLIECINQLR